MPAPTGGEAAPSAEPYVPHPPLADRNPRAARAVTATPGPTRSRRGRCVRRRRRGHPRTRDHVQLLAAATSRPRRPPRRPRRARRPPRGHGGAGRSHLPAAGHGRRRSRPGRPPGARREDRQHRPVLPAQAGINQADIVFEEKIEGRISRFASVFQSTDAADLGPVRSGRSTDVAIVSRAQPSAVRLLGANAVFLAKLRAAPLIDIATTSGRQLRPPSRPQARTTCSPRPVGSGRSPRPDAVAPGRSSCTAGPTIRCPPVPRGHLVRLRLRHGADRPAGHVHLGRGGAGLDAHPEGLAARRRLGAVITPTNVIVQFTPYHDTGMVDLSKTAVPEAELVGSGDRVGVHRRHRHPGHVVEARQRGDHGLHGRRRHADPHGSGPDLDRARADRRELRGHPRRRLAARP